ncbi:MAG: amino acid adenylation domain-containing protein, partial [Sarcina sp.]
LGVDQLALNLEGHGREFEDEGLELENTVGWFTSVYPVVLKLTEKNNYKMLDEFIQYFENIPNNGVTYGIYRYNYLSFETPKEPNITFNYLGEVIAEDGILAVKDYCIGDVIGKENSLWSDININTVLINGEINFLIDIDMSKYTQSFIDTFAKKIQSEALKFLREESIDKRILTPMQTGMMFHNMEKSESDEYKNQVLFKVTGKDINIEKLKFAIESIYQKYKSINMKIEFNIDGDAMQLLEVKSKEIKLLTFNSFHEGILADLKKNEFEKKFNLEKGNLFRCILVDGKEQGIYLLITFHHIILDGWSFENLTSSILQAYELLNDDKVSEFEKFIEQQDNFSLYLKELEKRELESKTTGKAYWKNLLNDYNQVANFDLIKKNYVEKNTEGSEHRKSIFIKEELKNKIEIYCKENLVNKSCILEAVLGIVLQKYNYCDDVVFGKVISGRNVDIECIEEIVGLLINTIPVRVIGKANYSFLDVLKNIQKQNVESNEYNYYSLAEIGALVEQKKLVQVIMSYSPFSLEVEDDEKLVGLKLISGREKSNYDLAVSVSDTDKEIGVEVIYNGGLFDSKSIERILEVFRYILEEVVSCREILIKDIKSIESQSTFIDYTNIVLQHNIPIPKIIEKYAEEIPQITAIRYKEESVNYEELNIKANIIANYLLANGAKKGDKIGILIDKSPIAVIAMVAVMKVGAICLAIDKGNPEQRIKYMLKDSESTLVITDKHIIDSRVKYLNIENLDFTKSTKNLSIELSLDDIAYVIYTSGTTGNPKCSLIKYKGMNNLFDYLREVAQLKVGESILQYASLSFDAAIMEIFLAFTSKCQVIIADDETRKNPIKLMELMNKEKVVFTLLPPVIMPFLNSNELPALKCLMNGGEEANPKIALEWSKGRRYINAYGPSETTIITSLWVGENLTEEFKRIPIGTNVPNTELYIISNGNLVANGLPGELYVGGVGLSTGYYKRPDINKEKFKYYPHITNGLLYKTGDLCRKLDDGNIIFLGRIDNQVKLRGNRIELGEVANKIKSLDGIIDAIVTINNTDGKKYLVAYFVSNTLREQDIRVALKGMLPVYMIPEKFVRLETIPITNNGKVDFRKLSSLEKITPSKKILKNNQSGNKVAMLLKEILSTDSVELELSFLDLGGDSISAIKFMIKSKKIGYNFVISDILSNMTIAELMTSKKNILLNSITYKDIETEGEIEKCLEYKATAMQNWISNQPNVVSGHNITIKEVDNITVIEEALLKLIKHHNVLRSSYFYKNNELFVKIHDFKNELSLNYKNISNLSNLEIEEILEKENLKFTDNG